MDLSLTSLDSLRSSETIQRALRVLGPDAKPYEIVARLYAMADLMEATDRAMTCVWGALQKSGHEDAVQAVMTDYDFLMRSRELRALADAWQDELDAVVPAHADRRAA